MPLLPDALYPAGVPGVLARDLRCSAGRVRVVEAGERDGDPVVLLHGWAGTAYNYRHVIPDLAARGYRVVAPELPGHGSSDRPTDPSRYSAEAMTAHVLELLDLLQLPRVVLVGQSMGGAIVLDTARAASQRLRAGLLLAPIGFSRVTRVSVARLLRTREWAARRPVPRWVVAFVLRRVYGTRRSWTERDLDEYWSALQDPAAVAALFRYVERFDWSPRPPARGLPPLRALFGERDKLIPAFRARDRARTVLGISADVIPGAGHLLAEEVPDEVVREIEDLAGKRVADAGAPDWTIVTSRWR